MPVVKPFRILKFKNIKPVLELKNVSISFGQRKILDNISFKLEPGTVQGLLGPNGSGKSTIFNLIVGALKPDSGKIFFGNKDATNYPMYLRSSMFSMSLCPQRGGFFGELSCVNNIRACAQILINNPIEENSVVDYLISNFNLYDVRNTPARLISGGQARRLVIALSLIGNKRIILLDEPFSALDPQAIFMLQKIIVNLPNQDKQQRSVLVTDHQPKALLAVCDSAMILSNSKIVASGSKNSLLKSKDAIDAYFGDTFSNL